MNTTTEVNTEVNGNIPVNYKSVLDTYNEYKHWCETNKSENKEEAKEIKYEGVAASRGWFMTINNPTPDDWNALIKDNYKSTYGQVEIGEENTPHIQVFVYYKSPKKKEIMIKTYPRAWIKPLRSFKHAKAYCTKTTGRIAGPFNYGEDPAQGSRNDLESIAQAMIDGTTTLEDVITSHPGMYIKYNKGLQALNASMLKHRTEKPTVIWLYGTTGTGKTKYAHDKHGAENVYIKDGSQWWNGYTQQQAIIIDDFDAKWPFRDLLRLLDRYQYQAQTKGDYAKINSPFIYITCEFHPKELYHDSQYDQLIRRIDLVIELTQNALTRVSPPGAPAGGSQEPLAAGQLASASSPQD